MDDLHGWTTWTVVLATGFVGWLLTGIARRVAPRLQLVDRPDGLRKLHLQPTPLMGGVAVFAALAFGLGLTMLVALPLLDAEGRRFAGLLLLSSGLVCGVGLIDDRWQLRARDKLVLQMGACVPLVLGTRPIGAVEFLGCEMQLGILGSVFVLGWLVVCTHVVNLLDGMDGLAGTSGLIAFVTLAVLSVAFGRYEAAMISLLAAASLLGFLIHNWPPAKIFLGDAGSLLIGFLVGALSLESSMKTAAGFALAAPLVVLAVPLFDTTMAVIRRKLSGRGIAEPDRGHIHHRLLEHGLTPSQSLLVMGVLSVLMSAAAVAAVVMQNDLLAFVPCLLVLAALVGGRVFGDRETRQTLEWLRVIGGVYRESLDIMRARLQHLDESRPAHHQGLQALFENELARRGAISCELAVLPDEEPFSRLLCRWIDPIDEDLDPAAYAWEMQLVWKAFDRQRLQLKVAGRGPSIRRWDTLRDISEQIHRLHRDTASETEDRRRAA